MDRYRVERTLLAALNAFLAITALLGGIGLITGMVAPPLGYLAGSPFHSYWLPGIALIVLVGGNATAACLMLLRHELRGAAIAAVAGAAIIVFELVEVSIIGSEAGPARVMQIFYLGLGIAIALLAARLWAAGRRMASTHT